MFKRVCSVEGCGRKHDAKGLCSMHRRRKHNRHVLERLTCSVEDCKASAEENGKCNMHNFVKQDCVDCGEEGFCSGLCKTCYYRKYQKERYHKVCEDINVKCVVEDCSKHRVNGEYCSKHYQQHMSNKIDLEDSCSIKNCNKAKYLKDLCYNHYVKQIPSYSSLSGKYSQLIYNAKCRNIEVNIDFIEYQKLTEHNCFYCNKKLGNTGHGLDRKNNNLGYTVDNCVPCCGTCNRLKNKFLTHEETIAIVKTVTK